MIASGFSLLLKRSLKPSLLKSISAVKRVPFTTRQLSFFSQQKQQQKKPDQPASSQPAQKKLSQLQFDDLIQMRTQQSLIQAQKRIVAQQKKVQANHAKLKQIAQQMQFLSKHEQQIKQKQLKLVENIQIQQQQLKRIKVRAQKQVSDSKKYSVTKLAKQLLEAADCINRCKNEAVKEYPNSKDPFIIQIIETQKKMVQVFKSFEIQEFDPTGKQFDPNTQESLLEIPVMPGCTANTVATTMRTGYFIQGRLLRSARVGIFSK